MHREPDDVGRRKVGRRAHLMRYACCSERVLELAAMAANAAQHDGNVTGMVARRARAVRGHEFCDLPDYLRGLVGRILLVLAMRHRNIGIAAVWDERSSVESIPLEKAIRASQNRTERA